MILQVKLANGHGLEIGQNDLEGCYEVRLEYELRRLGWYLRWSNNTAGSNDHDGDDAPHATMDCDDDDDGRDDDDPNGRHDDAHHDVHHDAHHDARRSSEPLSLRQRWSQ